MKIGIVVDATCDLPASFIARHGICILPIAIRLGADVLVDQRDVEQTEQFYLRDLRERGVDAESVPYTAEQIEAVFLDHLVVDHDLVFCITISGKHSPIFDHASRASFGILRKYKAVREQAGVAGPFHMRVLDSRTLFAGAGVLVAEAVAMIDAGAAPNQIRLRLDGLIPELCGYMVPADLRYIRERGFHKGERRTWADAGRAAVLTLGAALSLRPIIRIWRGEESVVATGFSHAKSVERLFRHLARTMDSGGLSAPHLCISYAGDVAEVPQMPGWESLVASAAGAGVEVHLATMSATGAVNVGLGCLYAAFAGSPGSP